MQNEERILGLVMMIVLGVTMIVVFNILRKNKRRAKQAEYDLEVAFSKIEMLEHQLKNASWELSDNIGQLISTMRMRLMVLVPDIPDGARANFMEVINLTGDSLKEIRHLHASIRQDLLDGGIVKLLREELERCGKMKPVRRSFTATGGEIRLDKGVEVLLISIVREFCSQLDKHTTFNDMLMEIDFSSDRSIKVFIKTGFIDSNAFKKIRMQNMERKAGLIKAALTINLTESDEVNLLLCYSTEFVRK